MNGISDTAAGFDENMTINESLLQSMKERKTECANLRSDIHEMRSNFLAKHIKTLQNVAEIQTLISRLKNRVSYMDKVIKGHNEHFSRLEGVSNLSKIYDAFIFEILRRKKFTASYESMVETAREEIMEFRRKETAHRESFMHKYGATLPQLFFSVVNSLNEKPPFCEITLTDKQWLPDIEAVDLSPNEALRLVHRDTFNMVI